MLDVKVLNMNGEEVGTLSLSEAVFGIEPNTVAMHAAVVNYLANRRHGTQSTKTRTEVRGGGRKPWRQKGTGHARQGSTRAPQTSFTPRMVRTVFPGTWAEIKIGSISSEVARKTARSVPAVMAPPA